MAGVPNGFEYEVRGGAVVIRHHGRLATTLRAAAADRFLTEVERGDPQLVLARRPGREVPGRRTPLGARPLIAAKDGARGYCGPADPV